MYLGLDDGPPRFPQGYSSPMVLRNPLEPKTISSTGLSPSLASLPRLFDYVFWSHIEVLQPLWTEVQRFSLLPFRSPLLGESRSCFMFLEVLRCFNSLRLLPLATSLTTGLLDLTPAEFPHSDTHGSTLVWQLTVIFRGLHRPSSPVCPKASTLCPESLIA